MSENNVKSNKPPRTRYFSCIMYDDPSTFEIDNILHEVFRSIAYIKHDSDVLDDGTPKQVHWHVLGVTPEKHSAKTVAYALAHLPQNIMVECAINREGAWDYLTHAKNPEKHQYDKKSIYFEAECKARFKGLKGDNREFVEDMESLSMRDLAYTYGRDVMRNFKAYREYIIMMRAQEEAHETPYSTYSYDPAEKEAIDHERMFIAYRFGCDGNKRFVHASDESIRKCITLALSVPVWKEFDRIVVCKLKTSSYQEYMQVTDMAYTEAIDLFVASSEV